MSKPKRQADCHPNLSHYAHDLCINCYHRALYAKYPEKYRHYRKRRRVKNSKPRNRRGLKRGYDTANVLLYNAADRARRRNIAFNLIPSDIQVPSVCPILGLTLERQLNRLSDCSPSLDRIDNNLGYVKGNVVVVSHRANRLKGDGTIEEHKKIVNFYTALQSTSTDGTNR